MQLACENDTLFLKELNDWYEIFFCFFVRIVKEYKIFFKLVNKNKTEKVEGWPTITINPMSTFLADF